MDSWGRSKEQFFLMSRRKASALEQGSLVENSLPRVSRRNAMDLQRCRTELVERRFAHCNAGCADFEESGSGEVILNDGRSTQSGNDPVALDEDRQSTSAGTG